MKISTALSTAVLVAIAASGCAAAPSAEDNKTASDGGVTSKTDKTAVSHVKIGSCKADEFGTVTAKLVINNKGKDQASYVVTAEAVKGNERIAELNGIANSIRPGQTAKVDAVGSIESSAGKFTCKVVSVDRF